MDLGFTALRCPDRCDNIRAPYGARPTLGGSMLKSLRMGLFAVGCLAVGQASAYAQNGSIAGIVRDTSGGVMPGVTVEAASPALIEKTRTAVTDSDGQYKIIDLRPGTYTVTFSLAGFSTV